MFVFEQVDVLYPKHTLFLWLYLFGGSAYETCSQKSVSTPYINELTE